MRELKFRVWVGYDKEFKAYQNFFTPIKDGTFQLKPYNDDIIIEQYTGLKDKNGKEIYEGDIIRNIEEVAPNKSKIYQVFYKVDFAKFDVAPVDDKIDILSGGFNFASMMHYEVIGNIHESNMEEA